MVSSHTININTRGFCDIIDITDDVQGKVKESGIKNGIVTVFIPGATGGITTIEYETGLIKDLKELMEEIIPENKDYHHNRRWGDGNGFSHLRASLIGPSVTIPINEGSLTLGTWQQIVFIDFDNNPRNRKIICQIVGE